MSEGRLVIGTKRYSSWSLRGWLAVHLAGLDVEEEVLALAGGTTPAVKQATPNGLVPYLEHRGARVWESLAICEYCAEIAPQLWPADAARRALLRSAATEMHGGFAPLRIAFPMITDVAAPGLGDRRRTAESDAALARIVQLWDDVLGSGERPYLHGAEMGVADAMYAPVALRIRTWGLDVPAKATAYVAAVHAHPLVKRWFAEAAGEPAAWRLEGYEGKLRGEG